eukprot:gi/632982766/ref/XP_007908317.1/ PREDICTED: UPF0317 protein C14orf159 homolog, mitochondrial [Callorhinchus milii]
MDNERMVSAAESLGAAMLLPAAVRALIRARRLLATNTSSVAQGYKQANIVIVHRDLADDFERFCQANSGPLPLLYRSKPGEWGSPLLSHASDIRTDCLAYRRYEDGRLTGTMTSLREYTEQMRDMVTFYTGCSFSFESILLKAGVPVRNHEQGRNVSMYKTSVPCQGVGSFRCNMVVTMRPIPEEKLDTVVRVTHLMQDVHGAPVHIGHPGLIGIEDLSSPDFGDAVEAHPGDIPVFWACGVTGMEAVQSCGSPLAFTHAPGCMFVTDVRSEEESETPACPADTPQVVRVCQTPAHYSIASASTLDVIRELEALIQQDPGNRGIRHLTMKDQLLKAALSLSHANSVLLTTGFPTHFRHQPPEETDGPPGALAMATMLQALKKDVAIVTDQRALELYRKIIEEAVEQGVLEAAVPLLSFQDTGVDSALSFLCHDGRANSPRYDHLIAIERSGMAMDGNYYNARKVNIKHLVDPIDKLFLAAREVPGISTTGIGDGGNELGMGKVKEAVKKYITNGDLIACDVEADFAIIAGVSNWGGYALACALYLLNCCSVHARYLRRAIGFPNGSERNAWTSALPSVNKEDKLLQILVKHGIRSGVTGNLGMEVDGLPFHDVHSSLIRQLLTITLTPHTAGREGSLKPKCNNI